MAPPVVVTPPVVRNPLLDDPQFNLAFYRQFVSHPLYRWTQPPMIYLQTVDSNGTHIDARILDAAAAAIINTTEIWSGGQFGVAGLERGTGFRDSREWINVTWSRSLVACGQWGTTPQRAHVITINANDGRCMCPSVIKHELGHAMGYWHTDSRDDLMTPEFQTVCDRDPSDRERFHSRVAYQMPPGSTEP